MTATDQQQSLELQFQAHDGSVIIDPADGEFVAISRLTISRDVRPGQSLKFEIVRTLTAGEFYALIDGAGYGPVSIGDLSNHLVLAFDLGTLTDRNGFNCMFVWRNAHGIQVEQHST